MPPSRNLRRKEKPDGFYLVTRRWSPKSRQIAAATERVTNAAARTQSTSTGLATTAGEIATTATSETSSQVSQQEAEEPSALRSEELFSLAIQVAEARQKISLLIALESIRSRSDVDVLTEDYKTRIQDENFKATVCPPCFIYTVYSIFISVKTEKRFV